MSDCVDDIKILSAGADSTYYSLSAMPRGRCRIVALILFLAASAHLVPAQGATTSVPVNHRFAILIGISEYEDKRLARLLGPVNDVQTIGNALLQSADFSLSNIFTLTSEQATRRNIVEALLKVTRIAPPDSLLIFAYSGYAFEKNGRGYLLPADGVAGELLDETGVSLDFLGQLLGSSGSSRVVVLLDTSFQHLESAPEFGVTGSVPGRLFSSFDNPRHTHCTAVYYPSDVAYEDVASKQGLFSKVAVEGLKGAAQDNTGRITARSLAAYLDTELIKESQTIRGSPTRVQSQVFCGDDFVISKPPQSSPSPSAITYYVSAVLHPSAELPLKVTQSYSVDDDGDCSVKQTRSATFCLDADAAVRIGDFRVKRADCGSKPLGGTINGKCITVDYLLLGCGVPGPSCGPARVAFDVPVEGIKYIRTYLDLFEAPRLRVTTSGDAPSFQYQGTIPPDARNIKWEYSAEVLRILHDEVIGDVRVNQGAPTSGGVTSAISGDGRLVVDVSALLEKWSHETK